MAARRKPGELDRLRGLVAEQHRRLQVARGALDPIPDALVIQEPRPPRCAKPRLTPPALGRLIDAARARLELMDTRLGTVWWSAWPERRPDVPTLRPTPGLAAYGLRDLPDLPNLIVGLFLREPAEIPAAVARILSQQRNGEPFAPIFLTHCSDFTVLREQRLAFEYHPLQLDATAPAPEPRLAAYLVTTLELTMRRWGVRQIVLA
jgi:hypothetical protein